MEPARLECPFLCGPHHEAWPIYDELATVGATRIVAPAALSDLADDRRGATPRLWRGKPRSAKVVLRERGMARCDDGIDRVLALLPA